MPTITVTGSGKMFYKGKAYRPGQSFEMSEHDYSQMKIETPKVKEVIADEPTEKKKPTKQ
mgnify:FL=1